MYESFMSCDGNNCPEKKKERLNGYCFFLGGMSEVDSYIAHQYLFEIRHPKPFVLVQRLALLILGWLGSKVHLIR